MSTFEYTALTRDGQQTQGRLEANDSREAVAALRSQQLFVVNLQERRSSGGTHRSVAIGPEGDVRAGTLLAERSRGIRYELGKLRPVVSRDKVLFFRQLALMLRAGITIVQALRVNARQSSSPWLERVALKLAADVQGGMSFSGALAEHPRYFSRIAVTLVESAEASGELDTILDQIATQIEEQATIKAQILTSLTYPAVVVVLSIAVSAFLVVKVIPKFASFFLRRGISLPWLTQSLVDVSDFVRDNGIVLLSCVAVACVIVFIVYSTRRGRYGIDVTLLKVPITGKLLISGALAQMSRNLAMLIRSGVTVFEALGITAKIMRNRALSVLLTDSADAILKGEPLARTFDRAILPPVVPQLLSVGEHTGALEEVLEELGQFYDQDLKSRIRRMAALVGPAVVLLVGGLVAVVYFAFFLALIQMISKGF